MSTEAAASAHLAAWLTLALSPACPAWPGPLGATPSTPPDPCAWVAALGAVGFNLRRPSPSQLDRLRAWLSRPNTRLVPRGSVEYPLGLSALTDPPPVLFVEGPHGLGSRPQVAVVGSRRASAGGLAVAERLGADLVAMGFTVVSGLALGIDAAAHRGALAAAGATLAVLGNGPDVCYPRDHAVLQGRIAATGALLSEFPPGVAPRPCHFPRRNRILSGLCVAVVVVEAALPSGSLITARLALDQGREVLAVPGSVLNPMARGCHALIRDGAHLVESAEDVWNALPPHLKTATRPPPPAASPVAGGELDAKSRAIWDALAYEAVSVDALVTRSGLTVSELSYILQALELDGRVVAGPDGTFQRKPERT